MQIKLSENIKRLRKERKMTQEQLAERMGVSVSAVYKWESGQSVPDIHFIFALAELFNTSTDVLLGYEWKNNSAAQMLARIDELIKEKAYDGAALEAEKALKNYPNHFAVVYRSALAYLEWGEDSHLHKTIRRAIELLETICEGYCMKGDFAQAKTYLKAAVDKAIRFDKAKPGEIRDMKFFSLLNLKNMPAYNMYRGTAMECLQQRIDIEAEIPQLCKLWQEIKEEIEHE